MVRSDAPIDYSLRGDGSVALLVMDNPPVNALGHALRVGLLEALDKAAADPLVSAIVLTGTGQFFSAGADIAEFSQPRRVPLADRRRRRARLDAEADDRRDQWAGSRRRLRIGARLPLATGQCCGETRVAGGQTRLVAGRGRHAAPTRLAGVDKAVQIMLSAEPIGAASALADGIVDALPSGDLLEASVSFAKQVVAERRRLRRARDLMDKIAVARANPDLLDTAAAPFLRRTRGEQAPQSCVRAIRGAFELPFEEGLRQEQALFLELLQGEQSRARRHVFYAEREAQKIPDLPPDVRPKPIERAVVIGAGTMGGGIAMCFANAGIPVTLLDTEQAALDRGWQRIAANYRASVERGKLAQTEMDRCLGALTASLDFSQLAAGDIVVEAVFEDIGLKQRLFADMDRTAKRGALLATNTSTLDVDKIAAATRRPSDVLGMHFFSPANVMRLLEIVRGKATSDVALATAMAVGKRIGKLIAVAGVCDGFIGNRMLARRTSESERLLLEGAMPRDVDAVVEDFGFPMGPFAMGDLAGLDIGWSIRKNRGVSAAIADALCEAGRFGQRPARATIDTTAAHRAQIPLLNASYSKSRRAPASGGARFRRRKFSSA